MCVPFEIFLCSYENPSYHAYTSEAGAEEEEEREDSFKSSFSSLCSPLLAAMRTLCPVSPSPPSFFFPLSRPFHQGKRAREEKERRKERGFSFPFFHPESGETKEENSQQSFTLTLG